MPNLQTTMAAEVRPKIEESWKAALGSEFQEPYFRAIKAHLQREKAEGQVIYPPGSLIFNAFDLCPLHRVSVVLIGQDPYHGPGQAHGLCFSVPPGVRVPPSLANMYRELKEDIGMEIPSHGNLESWARQGVLLLNTTLTVRARTPMSHSRLGWQRFTDRVIRLLSDSDPKKVFLLWGGAAKRKAELVDAKKHLVLTAAHPSPLSAHNGFFGCRHFSQANRFLKKEGLAEIEWQV